MVIDAALQGLAFVFSWPNILVPVAATIVAMVVALLPGLSGAALMALAIPLTFGWEPERVMLLFGALVGGATFMGSVTAILLNIPGTAPNAATLIDGYPMARNGLARTALAASATASALGSTFGIIVLIMLIPVMAAIVTWIGPPEYFLLAAWGLLAIGTIIRGSIAMGLAAAGLGLLVSFIGFDPRTAAARYTFGTLYLQDGLNVVPVFLGLFAIAEVMDLSATGRTTVSGRTRVEELGGSLRDGIVAVFRNSGLFLKSSIIGTVVGMIPGLGGTVAAFVAYGEAARTDTRGTMGQGDVRGVIAPEAANDAKDGGSLLPTLALGIPASAGTAVLLGAMALHGIRPGRELLGPGLPLTFVLIWSLFASNWITSIAGLSAVRPLARLTVVRTARLIPPILILATLGAFAFRATLADVAVAYAFGGVGYLMKKHGWSRVAFVMALVLGPVFEQNLHLSIALQQLDRINVWTRPSVLLLASLIVLTTVPTWIRRKTVAPGEHGRRPAQGAGSSPAFTLLLLLAPVVFIAASAPLSGRSRLVPLIVAVPLAGLLLYRFTRDIRHRRHRARSNATAPAAQPARPEDREPAGREWRAAAWLFALPGLTALAGFVVGPSLFVFAWLRWRGREPLLASLAAAVLAAAFIGIVFGGLLRSPLPPGIAGRWLGF